MNEQMFAVMEQEMAKKHPGRQFACASLTSPGGVLYWDLETGIRLAEFSVFGDAFGNIQISVFHYCDKIGEGAT